MIKHVSFDVAGTLYPLTPEILAARDKLLYSTYARLTNEQDFRKAKNDYDSLYDKYGSNSAVFHSLGKPWDFWQITLEDLDLVEFLKPDNKINSILKMINDRVYMSIFSTFRIGRIHKILKKLEIPNSYFSFILSGDDAPERKPNLAGFCKTIQLSKLPASRIIYVGDRIETDIRPAKEAGLRT